MPCLTGSALNQVHTIGIVLVNLLRSVEPRCPLPATITSTLRWTSSAARSAQAGLPPLPQIGTR